MTNSIQARLRDCAATLETCSDSPLLDCQILLAHTLGKPREWLYAHNDEFLTDLQIDAFEQAIAQRVNGVPVAHLTGYREFWGRRFIVSEATLIPRPETELLVELALAQNDNSKMLVADLGTGSGAIAVTLAAERSNWSVVGVDNSPAALAIAQQNQKSPNLQLIQGSWLQCFNDHSLDLIVSNPPYIRTGDEHMPALRHEPESALVSGEDGLTSIREIVKQATLKLKPGGQIILEHGYDQQFDVMQILTDAGFSEVTGHTDLAQTPRAVTATINDRQAMIDGQG